MLVGNKADTVADLTAAAAQGRAYADAEKIAFFAASAKTGDGVTELFEHLVSKLPVGEAAASKGGAPVVQVTAQVPRQQPADCSC